MRFRFNALPLKHITLCAALIYVLQLAITKDLNLYIHPRYTIFTAVMSAAGLIAVIADLYFSLKMKAQAKPQKTQFTLAHAPLLVLLLAALVLPAKTLSSATVSQRLVDSGSITGASNQRTGALFAGSSKGLRLQDWANILQVNDEASYYTNKPAKISGFLYDAQLGSDTVWIARFVLTCCAVDVQPIGVPVHIENWQSTYSEDTWLEIEGDFQRKQTAQGEQIVLTPTTITPIEQPENPYAN